MNAEAMVVELNAEIDRLTQARDLLTGTPSPAPQTRRTAAKSPTVAKAAKKSGMTPEGRKRIADAMKKRWAAKRVATPAKSAPKK
jgi:hypothetical protein